MFDLLLTHCPKELKAKLKSFKKWANINSKKDCIKLTKLICSVTHKHDESRQGTMAMMKSDRGLYITFMGKDNMPEDFYDLFKANYETINAHGGRAGYHPVLHKQHTETGLQETGKTLLTCTPDEKKNKQRGNEKLLRGVPHKPIYTCGKPHEVSRLEEQDGRPVPAQQGRLPKAKGLPKTAAGPLSSLRAPILTVFVAISTPTRAGLASAGLGASAFFSVVFCVACS